MFGGHDADIPVGEGVGTEVATIKPKKERRKRQRRMKSSTSDERVDGEHWLEVGDNIDDESESSSDESSDASSEGRRRKKMTKFQDKEDIMNIRVVSLCVCFLNSVEMLGEQSLISVLAFYHLVG